MNYKIVNPITNKMNSLKSKLGKELLKKYLLHLQSGGNVPEQVKSIKVVDKSTVDPNTILDAEIVKPEDIVDPGNIITASPLET